MSRPYTVSEEFDEGNFIAHLLAEVAKVQTTIFGVPFSTRVEAHPTVFPTPYDKRPFVKLLVQPPPRKDVSSRQRLMVSFHFTHRAGVAVQVFDAGNDAVGIIIVLGDLNRRRFHVSTTSRFHGTSSETCTPSWSALSGSKTSSP